MLKTLEQQNNMFEWSCANGCERCLYKAYCFECGFLMADFDETSRSCENDKIEISAYERIKVIFFMTVSYNGTRSIVEGIHYMCHVPVPRACESLS